MCANILLIFTIKTLRSQSLRLNKHFVHEFVRLHVCFHLIHLRDAGRISGPHQSLLSDSVTPCDPTFTWVSPGLWEPLITATVLGRSRGG